MILSSPPGLCRSRAGKPSAEALGYCQQRTTTMSLCIPIMARGVCIIMVVYLPIVSLRGSQRTSSVQLAIFQMVPPLRGRASS